MRIVLFTEIELADNAVLQMHEQIKKNSPLAIEGRMLEQAICEGMVRAADLFFKQLPGVKAQQTVFLPPLLGKLLT